MATQEERQGPALVVIPVLIPKYYLGLLWSSLWVFYLN